MSRPKFRSRKTLARKKRAGRRERERERGSAANEVEQSGLCLVKRGELPKVLSVYRLMRSMHGHQFHSRAKEKGRNEKEIIKAQTERCRARARQGRVPSIREHCLSSARSPFFFFFIFTGRAYNIAPAAIKTSAM